MQLAIHSAIQHVMEMFDFYSIHMYIEKGKERKKKVRRWFMEKMTKWPNVCVCSVHSSNARKLSAIDSTTYTYN